MSERGLQGTDMEAQERNLTTIDKIEGQVFLGEIKYQPHITGSDRSENHIPSSVERIRQPVSHFVETQTYNDIKAQVENQRCAILHCYGYAGTGKSEIVRKLASTFPFTFPNPKDVTVKWYIECADYKHDIKMELQDLVKAMHKKSVLPENCNYQNIIEDLEKEMTSSLARALKNSVYPVLIVFEGVPTKSKKILFDLFRSIKGHSECVLHIYVTSRAKSTLLSKNESAIFDDYHNKHVHGFNEAEGLQFLLNREDHDHDETSAAKRVFDHFSGNPMALQSAKTYCQKSLLNYSDYMEWIDSGCADPYQLDENIVKQYGSQAQHIFQALILPFRPSENASKQDKLLWNILRCLSFLHYGYVPRYLLECLCQHFREEPAKNTRLSNKTEAGQIITKLCDYEMCFLLEDDSIGFHEVVLHAFQVDICQSHEEHKKIVIDTLLALASVVTKDTRRKEVADRMMRCGIHIRTLMKFADEFLEGADDLVKMVASHLLEVLGGTTVWHPLHRSESEVQLVAARDLILDVVASRTNTSVEKQCDFRQADLFAEYAESLVETCSKAGATLTDDFVSKYEQKICLITSEEKLSFLERKSTDKRKFQQAKKLLGSSKILSQEVIEKFRACGVFLSETAHKKVFFASRLASILHSLSRVILYKDLDYGQQHIDPIQYIGYSKLAHAIAEACRVKFNIGLLVEHLTLVGGTIPIMLKSQKLSCEEEKKAYLNEAIAMCEEVLEGDNEILKGNLYENGLLQEIECSSYLKALVYRDLVRIFARLIKMDASQKEKGYKYCRELLQLAEENPTLTISSLCYVYGGKFLCACEDYESAMPYFKKVIANNLKPFNAYSWVIYNFARCALCGRLQNSKGEAIQECEKVLNSTEVISVNLNFKLSDTLQRLIDASF